MDTKTKWGWAGIAALIALAVTQPVLAQSRGGQGSGSGSGSSVQWDDDASRRRAPDAALSHYKDGTPPRSVSERSDKDERKKTQDDGNDSNKGRGTGYRTDTHDSDRDGR
ncbi:MAG: hypothetical protein ACXU8O_01650 [Asticcacaulis sp.]